AGRGGHIVIKANALVDKSIIKLFYRASMAGVKIELIIRGICCLRPGIEGISENISVRSVVGRFLEHSRIYYFQNGGEPEVYLGSADMMPRNIDRRVEVLFPIEDEDQISRIRDEVLDAYLRDNWKVRLLQPDGTYERASAASEEPTTSVQELFLKQRLLWQTDDALVPGSG
ncbi:MAG: hypothetical protein R3282_09930, partial [Rhodothermales bacterium]|nr:hypothetical protein [Rhodothermales bacterium]